VSIYPNSHVPHLPFHTSHLGSAGSATRAFTVEQESECKRVIALSKKSHYECLGIVKSASENEIKIAYRYVPKRNTAACRHHHSFDSELTHSLILLCYA
jgi:hypothetical protein